MKKKVLTEGVAAVKTETGAALQIMYDALNQGQKKKIAANPQVAALFERYGVT